MGAVRGCVPFVVVCDGHGYVNMLNNQPSDTPLDVRNILHVGGRQVLLPRVAPYTRLLGAARAAGLSGMGHVGHLSSSQTIPRQVCMLIVCVCANRRQRSRVKPLHSTLTSMPKSSASIQRTASSTKPSAWPTRCCHPSVTPLSPLPYRRPPASLPPVPVACNRVLKLARRLAHGELERQVVLKQIRMGALGESDDGGATRYVHPPGSLPASALDSAYFKQPVSKWASLGALALPWNPASVSPEALAPTATASSASLASAIQSKA